MQQITPRYDSSATRNFVLDEVPIPPAQVDQTPPPRDKETQAALITVTVANVAMSLIIIIAMILDGSKAGRAIIAGAFYFLASSIAFSFIITGSLTAIVNHRLSQHTERRRIEAYQELGGEWMALRRLEMTQRRGSARGVQRISPLSSYVSPYADEEDEVRQEALAWAGGLYGADGHPNPRMVHDGGRLRCRMLGSKRGHGSQDAGRWLLHNGVIRKVSGGYALLLPHRRQLDNL